MTSPKLNVPKAIVIGGGVSGLASAALLAKQGWKVTLLEKNATLGGRARTLELEGYTFDMGPSWYMMPEVFDRFFAEFGKKTTEYYSLIRLDPRYKIFFKKKEVTLSDNLKHNFELFEKMEVGAGKKLEKFLQKNEKAYRVAIDGLMYKNIWNLGELLSFQNIKALFSLSRQVTFWGSWQQSLDASFRNTSLKQILGFTALFLGGSPAATPSIFSVLAWADFGEGIWYPKGGMKKLVQALTDLCRLQGVEILTGQDVTKIEVLNDRVVGVRVEKKFFPADIVVGATDLPWLETQLLEKRHQTYSKKYWESKTLGISALMIYLGLNKRFPQFEHHSLYFADNWNSTFAEIFDEKKIPTDPSLYISTRSATDRSLVPKESEEIVILVPLGAKATYDQKDLEKLGQKVIKKLEALIKAPLEPHIVVKELFTPRDFQKDYHAYQGTALGLAHTPSQSLWGRPRHKSSKVQGLYYAGQYTNPGVGLPTSIVSAQISARIIGFASAFNTNIFKKGSTTYYYSSLFFSGQVKHDVFTLYAYVRTIDDFVDSLDPSLDLLDEYWKETKKSWNGERSNIHIVQQFVSMARRKKFEWAWIEAFWNAMRSDLTKTQYKDFKELEEYMYGSAEVIGFMMTRILDLPNEVMQAAALQGKAMQLLNFVRDVDEDRSLKRKYLVYDESGRDEAQWGRVVNEYLEKYFALQREAERSYAHIPRKYRIPIKTAAKMYEKTARVIHQNPMIVWRKKVKPSKWQVLFELARNTFV